MADIHLVKAIIAGSVAIALGEAQDGDVVQDQLTYARTQVAKATALAHNTAWDGSVVQHATVDVNGSNFIVAAPTGAIDGAYYSIYVAYTTTHTLSWAAMFKGVANITPTAQAGKHDQFFFRFDGAQMECVGSSLDIGA